MKIFGIAIVLLFLSSIPLAAAQEEKAEYLNARYTKIACGIDFRINVLKVTAEEVPQASDLLAHVETLSKDKAELQAIAMEGNSREFREYLRETLRPHMKEAKEAFKEDRKRFREWNISRETILELRREYNESKTALKACREAAVVQVGKAKVAWYEAILEKKEARAANLSAKGVDTAEMMEIIANAWTRIVTPLREAVSSEDPETVKNALRMYRLFNGGNESSISYHFAAKYQVARLGAILAAIAPAASDAGYEDEVAEIQGVADSAEEMLSGIGDRRYAPGEGEQVWSNIRQGFTMLKELIKSLKG
jgi:hypothetical protein